MQKCWIIGSGLLPWNWLCHPAPLAAANMDKSTQELFLNFMVVLMTVLLMWMLVKSYQEWGTVFNVKPAFTINCGSLSWLCSSFTIQWLPSDHLTWAITCLNSGLFSTFHLLPDALFSPPEMYLKGHVSPLHDLGAQLWSMKFPVMNKVPPQYQRCSSMHNYNGCVSWVTI